MIPNHVLDALTPETRVAILARGGEIHFLIHQATDDPATVQAVAAREGSEALTTHMRDQAAIQEFVTSRERDVGGEG